MRISLMTTDNIESTLQTNHKITGIPNVKMAAGIMKRPKANDDMNDGIDDALNDGIIH